jgi:hypothetical protein
LLTRDEHPSWSAIALADAERAKCCLPCVVEKDHGILGPERDAFEEPLHRGLAGTSWAGWQDLVEVWPLEREARSIPGAVNIQACMPLVGDP